MIVSSSMLSCNFSPLHLKSKSTFSLNKPAPKFPLLTSIPNSVCPPQTSKSSVLFNNPVMRRTSARAQSPKEPPLISSEEEIEGSIADGEGERDWTTSFLLLVFWAGLIYYVTMLAPNQTPVTDLYFIKKLAYLKGDDGFQLNQVLIAVWYIMGLWPLVYSMLLIPSGRSSKSKIPVWPFLALSFFLGAYALIPYFVLWKPPPPPVQESELRRWPLNFLESKLTAGVTLGAGVAIIAYAFSCGGDEWKEYYQYFQGSKFIHIMSIDLGLLSTLAPFWVYNDMTVRKCNWDGKGFWLLPPSLVPFLGPALYLLLRPTLSVASKTHANLHTFHYKYFLRDYVVSKCMFLFSLSLDRWW